MAVREGGGDSLNVRQTSRPSPLLPSGAGAQIVPNLGEKREESSGRQCTNRSAVTACHSNGCHRKFSAISHLQKRVAPNSNPCLPASSSLVGLNVSLLLERGFGRNSFSSSVGTETYPATARGVAPDGRKRSISSTVLRAVRPTPTSVADA